MTPAQLHLEIMLICEICDGEVDVRDDRETAQCRHCGIAFMVDSPEVDERLRA